MSEKNKLEDLSIKDIVQLAAILNLCVECKKDFLKCDERRECEEFYENCKTAYIAIDMYKKFKK